MWYVSPYPSSKARSGRLTPPTATKPAPPKTWSLSNSPSGLQATCIYFGSTQKRKEGREEGRKPLVCISNTVTIIQRIGYGNDGGAKKPNRSLFGDCSHP